LEALLCLGVSADFGKTRPPVMDVSVVENEIAFIDIDCQIAAP
jgi:hypothetical protein